jgi:hypothetical protein
MEKSVLALEALFAGKEIVLDGRTYRLFKPKEIVLDGRTYRLFKPREIVLLPTGEEKGWYMLGVVYARGESRGYFRNS